MSKALLHFVTYDPASGAILARYQVTTGQETNYQNITMITQEDFTRPMEITHKVIVSTGLIVNKAECYLSYAQVSAPPQIVITVDGLVAEATLIANDDSNSVATVTPQANSVVFNTNKPGVNTVRLVTDINHYSWDVLEITV